MGTKDNVSYAWGELLKSTLDDYNIASLSKLKTWEENYTKKYGDNKIDLNKLNAEEKSTFENLKYFYKIWSNYFNFLVALKFFYTISTLEHDLDIVDVDTSVGEVDSIGSTLDKSAEHDWNQESKNVLLVFRSVNKLLPSEYELQLANSPQNQKLSK